MDQASKNDLRLHLLKILHSLGQNLKPGESVLVQPQIDGTPTTNPISVSGYDWQQIDSMLREMCETGLISSGSATYDAPAIGIFFSSLTPRGRELLGG